MEKVLKFLRIRYDEAKSFKGNMLIPVFCNGNLLMDYSLNTVRNNLYGGKF